MKGVYWDYQLMTWSFIDKSLMKIYYGVNMLASQVRGTGVYNQQGYNWTTL